MFCPRCGEEMVVDGSTLKCASGNMQLSPRMHEVLAAVFVARARRASSHARNWGGRWFCPGCGVPMKTDGEHVRCETCGEYLDEFVHGLVELHPHRTA